MGHYRSEMADDSSYTKSSTQDIDPRYADEFEGPAKTSYSGIVRADRTYGSKELYHHLPCGGAVYDQEKHLAHCPARQQDNTTP